MTRDAARQALARWRPGLRSPPDAEVAEALKLAAHDALLQTWWERHQRFLVSTQTALRSLQPPAGLPEQIQASLQASGTSHRGISALFTPPLRWLATAAAAVLVAAGLWAVLSNGPRDQADFPTFRGRMVRAALREYRMDMVTNDLASIRSFLLAHQAPADFVLPPALAAVQPIGCGLLGWQGHPVSMVCLKDADLGMLYLFIVPANSFDTAAPPASDLARVNKLATASWTRGTYTYVLAASSDLDGIRRFANDG